MSTGRVLEGGLVVDEHRLRRAQMRQREVELEGRRLDARIASLESLATQATLLAGFSYAVLRPDSISGLLNLKATNNRIGPSFIAACSAVSFCTALWVVYMAGYASIRARIAFLQGSKRDAVRDALGVLIETQTTSRVYFDVSMATLALSACAVIIDSTPLLFSFPILMVFVLFILQIMIHKRRVDQRLHKWTRGLVTKYGWEEDVGQWIDQVDRWSVQLWQKLADVAVSAVTVVVRRLCKGRCGADASGARDSLPFVVSHTTEGALLPPAPAPATPAPATALASHQAACSPVAMAPPAYPRPPSVARPPSGALSHGFELSVSTGSDGTGSALSEEPRGRDRRGEA